MSCCDKIKRLMGAANSIVKGVVHPVSNTIQSKRNAVCNKCQYLTNYKGLRVCGPIFDETQFEKGDKTCGCIIALKVRDPEQECPNNYWGKEKEV